MKKIVLRALCFVSLFTLIASIAATAAFAANEDSSILTGVKVGFYGDSICAAARENRIGWAGRVGDKHQMIWDNNAQGGWAVSNCRDDTQTIYYQLMSTRFNPYDMVILHGGTNDAWGNAPIGEMTDDFLSSQEYSQDTFAGGLEKVFAFLRERRPDAIVGYIINFKFLSAIDDNGKKVDSLNNMQEYIDMTKKICNKWEIPYLDLYSNDELTAKLHPTDVTGRYAKTYLRDFIHPTSEGYDILAPYVESFMIELAVNAKAEEETTDLAVADTDAATEAEDTTVETTEQVSADKSGCGATLPCAALTSIGVILGGVTLLCRRKSKNKK